MIVNAILGFVAFFLGYAIQLLPAYTGLPTDLQLGLAWFMGKAIALSAFLPTTTIFTIFLLSMAIELGILAFNFFAWVLHWKQAKS